MSEIAGHVQQPVATYREPTWIMQVVVMLVGISAFINVYSLQSILPLLIDYFKATPVQGGIAVGATIFAVALISPFMGVISDAVGRRVLIILSIFFLSVPTALIYFATSIEQVIVYRLLQGVVVPGITVVIMAYVGEEFKGHAMGKMMSAYILGTVLGGFLGRFIVGHLSEFMSWQEAFLVMALMNFVMSIVVFTKLPKSEHFVANPNVRSAVRVFNTHIHNKDVWAACITGAAILFSLVGCFTYINLYLVQDPFHLSSSDLANVFCVYLLGIVATPLSARLNKRFGGRTTIILSLVLSSVGLLITFSHSVTVIVIGLAIMSSGIFMAQTATTTYLASKVSSGRSLASGLYYLFYYVGGSSSAWLCGYAYVYGGWTLTVITLIAVQLLGVVLVWFFMANRHDHEKFKRARHIHRLKKQHRVDESN